MQNADIYEERFEYQICETASLMDELKETESIIKKEGRTIKQTTYANSDKATEKTVEHPLLGHLRALHKDIPAHLAALGLNFQSMKKAEAKRSKNQDESDPTREYFQTING